MLRLLTFACLILLAGCGPRRCILNVPNPYYTGESSFYDDPGGQKVRGGGDAAAAPPSSSMNPPLTVADAPAQQHKPAQPEASRNSAAPMSLASRPVSTPRTYDEPASDGYDAFSPEREDDYVRPRNRERDDWGRPRGGRERDEYVTRNPRQRDRPMYGDDHRARDRHDRGHRNRDENYADSGRNHHGERDRGGRDHANGDISRRRERLERRHARDDMG